MHLLSLFIWWNPFYYARSHMYHHRYTQYLDGDRENVFPLEPNLGITFFVKFSLWMYSSNPVGHLEREAYFIQSIWPLDLLWAKLFQLGFPVRSGCKPHIRTNPENIENQCCGQDYNWYFNGSVFVYSIWSGQWALPFLISVFTFTANWLKNSVVIAKSI